jgi:hypothetical protein
VDGYRFEALIRTLTGGASRRGLLGGLASAAAGFAMARFPDEIEAKKKRKRKNRKPKLKRNEFGCVDVGGKCLGNDANCCSGICDGKKPKRGKKDTSACIAHDNGVCFPENDTCTVGANVPCNPDNTGCFCALTTGNAGFCGNFTIVDGAGCRECSRDTDCQEDLGPGAACVFLGGICSSICATTGRTACIRPCTEEAP